MKKLLLLKLLLLFTIRGFAQSPEVSPYFPDNHILDTYQTQFTYYDLNFVNYRIQEYLDINMAMVLRDTKYNLNEGHGTIEYIYAESMVIGSNRNPQQIKFIYTVGTIGKHFVIKKCKITGASNKVASFFVGFWKTDLQLDKAKKERLVYNNYLQDKITLYFNSGNYYVEIVNTSLSDFNKFKNDFLLKKKNFYKQKEESEKEEILVAQQEKERKIEEEKQLEIINDKLEEEEQKLNNTKIYDSTITIKKKKGEITTPNNVSKALIKDVEVFLKDKKDGDYIIFVKTTYEYEVEIKNEFKIYRFTPFKSVGEKVLSRFL